MALWLILRELPFVCFEFPGLSLNPQFSKLLEFAIIIEEVCFWLPPPGLYPKGSFLVMFVFELAAVLEMPRLYLIDFEFWRCPEVRT